VHYRICEYSITRDALPHFPVRGVSLNVDVDLELINLFLVYCSTLQKLYSYLRAQQELGTIKRFLTHSEIAAQLESCEKEMKVASEIFIVRVTVLDNLEKAHFCSVGGQKCNHSGRAQC
jgi:hypothetical protein